MSALLPLEDAQARLLESANPLGGEIVSVADAEGRYLAQPLLATRTQPPADLSAMDGFAVTGTGPWTVVGESRCGAAFDGKLSEGEAVHISTGAILPEGGDAILIKENARLEGSCLHALDAIPVVGRHIRRKGFDFTVGDALLSEGARIGPVQVALTLAGGHASLEVGKRPTVALIESGDELSADPASCAEGQIPASNNAMLAAMIKPLTESTQLHGPIADRPSALLEAFDAARQTDVLVISGGASVGDHDHVQQCLIEWGATIDFWRVAIRPGKPLMVGRKGRQIVIGLPGNPVSAFVTCFLFVLPLLRRLASAASPLPKRYSAPSLSALPQGGTRCEFVRASLHADGLQPVDSHDSSALASLARADALIARAEGCEEAKAGTSVPYFLLQNGGEA